jgi:hypothetical protein
MGDLEKMADSIDIEGILEAPYKPCLTISHFYSHEFTFDSTENCQS